VGVGLIWHHPASRCNLQLSIPHQPEDKDLHSGQAGTLTRSANQTTPACLGLTSSPKHRTKSTNTRLFPPAHPDIVLALLILEPLLCSWGEAPRFH
jgi:hypothetical protein